MRSVRKPAVLAILSVALAIISLDNTIVNVALPTLQEQLRATTADLQWVIDAYSVLFAGTLLIAGSLGDRFGRRRILILGLVVFLLGSAGAGMATSTNMLIAFRAVMGVGAAFVMPSTLSILARTFPERRERAMAIGVWSAVAGVGVALGPVVGGLLLQHLSWNAIFWVNPPIAIAVIAAAFIWVPESRDPSRPSLDVLGAILSSAGLIALVVTVIELPANGFGARTLTLGAIAALLLVAFVLWERRAPAPLLPLSFFREPLFVVSIVLVGLVYFALMGTMFFVPQFFQLVQAMSPLASGLAILPGAGGMLIASLFSARIAERIGNRAMILIGLGLVAVGLAIFSFISVGTPYPLVGVNLAVVGIGLGFTLPQVTNGVLAAVPIEKAGTGSAVNDAMTELGGALGVAVLGAMLSSSYRASIEQAIQAAGDRIAIVPANVVAAARESLASASISVGRLPEDVAAAVTAATGRAFVSGMGWALVLAAVMALLGLLLAWWRFPRRVERIAE